MWESCTQTPPSMCFGWLGYSDAPCTMLLIKCCGTFCQFFNRPKGRTRVGCVCLYFYQHFGGWGFFPSLCLHHVLARPMRWSSTAASVRSPTKSPRKLVAAAATAEEAVLGCGGPPPVFPPSHQFFCSGLPGSMSLTASITLGGRKRQLQTCHNTDWRRHNKSPFLMGKSTISVAIFW